MRMMRVMGLMGLMLMATMGARADQFFALSINVATGLGSLTNTTVTSTSGTAISVPQNTDVVIQPSIVAAGAETNVVTFKLNLSTDGSTWSTTYPITSTVTANGTTAVVGWTQISRTNLAGAKYMRLDAVTTAASSAITVSGVKLNYYY